MTDLDPILQADELLHRDAPVLWRALSPLGQRLRQPANFLPLQTAEARGKRFNATIGQITDGRGKAVPLPTMAAALAGLEPQEASQSFLYSPVEGIAVLRSTYRDWQRRGLPENLPSTLPLVTDGVLHARGLALQIFVPAGRTVIFLGEEPDPALRELVEARLGGRLVGLGDAGPPFAALERELLQLPPGEQVLVLVGAAAESDDDEIELRREGHRAGFAERLLEIARTRPLVVAIDDRWESLEAPASLFWDLAGRSENLIPVKLDGAEGSWGFAGGRVGFLTFAYAEESGVARALESKVKMLLRAEVGSPSAFAQTLCLKMLQARQQPAAGPEIPDPTFRAAVAAIDAGDTGELERLLADHPGLLRDRLDYGEGYFRNPYLLWFVAENPVRNDSLPENIAEVTRTIVRAAEAAGVESLKFQLDYTLGLVCSGRVARERGVQGELIDLLVEAGADPERALEPALAHREMAAVERLLERGAPLTFLTAACLGRTKEVIRLGREASAGERQAALAGAALHGQAEVLALLIDQGADLDAFNPSGLHAHGTALHNAVDSGSLPAVRVLAEAGGDLRTKDLMFDGTPLDWAEYLKRPEIAAYLREKEVQG
jgi:peptide-methionine (S)-S-oxide reductase